MPKKLSQEEISRAKEDGCVFPIRIMPAREAGSYLQIYEHTETREDVPSTLSVKPHILFRWFYELGTTSTLIDAIEDLIGPDILMTTSSVWAKNARDPRFVTWHQDSAYFGYDPMDVWSAWIAITDSHLDNGCLRYLPGSHRKPEMAHEETWDKTNMLSRGQRISENFDTSSVVNVELEPGECTLHHFRLAHSSEPNQSDRRRIGILFVFCPPYVRPTLELDTAILVRGEDQYCNWKPDPVPDRDLDPDCLDHYHRILGTYVDPETRSEVERRAAS